MAYSVREIFYTLQGEGARSGRPAVFCRFSGCNLWSGREEDRGKGAGGCSAWCDTEFRGVDGPGGGRFDCPEALAAAVHAAWPRPERPADDGTLPYVVCTGGEPGLQLDAPLLAALHGRGFEVAIETNGTVELPAGIDWVCVSPKAGAEPQVLTGQELKLVHPQEGVDPARFAALDFQHFYLQPLDGPERERAVAETVQYCKQHPRWSISLQIHKLLKIP